MKLYFSNITQVIHSYRDSSYSNFGNRVDECSQCYGLCKNDDDGLRLFSRLPIKKCCVFLKEKSHVRSNRVK